MSEGVPSASGWSIGAMPSGRWDWRAWKNGNRHFGTAPTRREAERCAREALGILKDQAARVARQKRRAAAPSDESSAPSAAPSTSDDQAARNA